MLSDPLRNSNQQLADTIQSFAFGMRTTGRQSETDNPSGTYLRDNNDKSKQVSN